MRERDKTQRQRWLEKLSVGDWILTPEGVAVVLMASPDNFLCEARDGMIFWTTPDKLSPLQKIRWVRKTKPKRKYKPKRKPAGRKRLYVKVNEPEFGIYLYEMEKLLVSDIVEYPCVKIYVSEGHKVQLDFLRHAFAKPLTQLHTEVDVSEESLLRLAAAHAARIYKERY